MSQDRDKFLTEAMGECWHNEYRQIGQTFEDRYETFVCLSCNKASAYSPSLPRNNFSTWEGFGKLWEWAVKQEWWHNFQLHYLKGTFGVSPDFFRKRLINPDKLANAIYEFIQDMK